MWLKKGSNVFLATRVINPNAVRAGARAERDWGMESGERFFGG